MTRPTRNHRPLDTALKRRLKSPAVLEQLLVWLVRGAVAWAAGGLGDTPPLLRAALDSYREDNDALGRFIADNCEASLEYRVSSTEFLQRFNDAEEPGLSAPALKKALARRGHEVKLARVEGHPLKAIHGLRWKVAASEGEGPESG